MLNLLPSCSKMDRSYNFEGNMPDPGEFDIVPQLCEIPSPYEYQSPDWNSIVSPCFQHIELSLTGRILQLDRSQPYDVGGSYGLGPVAYTEMTGISMQAGEWLPASPREGDSLRREARIPHY